MATILLGVYLHVLSGAFMLGNTIPYINSLVSAVGAAAILFSIIDNVPSWSHYKSEIIDEIKPAELQGQISFQDVYFSYPSQPEVQVLNGLSLNIKPGQTVAIVGPSGSGKTTVISLLMRFYNVSHGTITIDGMALRALNSSWLRSQIGVVTQDSVLFNTTISENIRYGRLGVSQDEIELAATMANAHSFIIDLPQGYDTPVGEHGMQLSGGQKQRIALARALLREPRLLLLDEATSAMDCESESIVHEALEYAMKGRTTIIVAHRLSTIRNADLIYTLDKGRVVEQGTHDELMARKGVYYRLVNIQAALMDFSGSLSDDMDAPINQLVPTTRFESEVSLFEPERDAYPENEWPRVTLRLLIKMNRPEYSSLALGLIGCAVSGMVVPIFAFFYSQLFATLCLVGDQLQNAAELWSALFLVLAVAAAGGIWLELTMMSLAAESLVKRVRLLTFSSIMRQPLGWFQQCEYTNGSLLDCLARDAPLIKGAAGLRLGQILSSTVTLLVALVVSLVFGWRLALLLLLLVPLIISGAYQQTVKMRHTQQYNDKSLQKANMVLLDCIHNIKTVQALNLENFFTQQYTEALLLPFRETKDQAIMNSVIFALSQAVVYVIYAVAFWYGVHLVQEGAMTPAQLYRVFFVLVFSATSVGSSSAYVQNFRRAKCAAQQMFRLIDRRSEIDALSQFGLKPKIEGLVIFEKVYFSYPSRPDVRVLRSLNLKVLPGQTLALVGPSGCGKSTVLALLERFYQPTSGSVKVDGIDIEEINIHHLRHHIGLVTQEPVLFNQSIRENIVYGLVDEESDDIMSRVISAATIANCHKFISQLPQGYETRVGEGGSQLSSGQKQRIAIARALVRDPRILLLDEATSSLDSDSETVVQKALDKARRGRTCIIIAHRLSTIQNADVIAVLDQGKIRETGSHHELMSQRGIYYQLVKSQRRDPT